MQLYNRFVEHLIMPGADAILGVNFMQNLRDWRKLDHWTPQQILSLQDERLFRLLKHASTAIPFYRKHSIQPKDDPREWLKAFPILHKSDIREHLQALLLEDPSKLVCEKSSGSSGIQGEVYMTHKEQFAAIAAQTHLWEWAGYRLGNPLLQLGMTPNRKGIKGIKDQILRTSYQQAFTIDERVASRILSRFVGKNGFLGGYASGLYAYACLAERLGMKVKFKGVISWGDKMFDHYRKKIEQQFCSQVFDTYGTTEGFVISGECEYGKHHIMTPQVLVELIDKEGKEVSNGEIGYVVATRLDAYAMPLIRYYLGDLAIKSSPDKNCLCGRPYPMLEKIIGRDTDIVRTPSGKFMIVHFFTGIFEHISEIQQFRVIQNDLREIRVEYIPGINFSYSVLELVEKKILNYIQEPFQITFLKVEKIQPTASGKPQIIQSTIGRLSSQD